MLKRNQLILFVLSILACSSNTSFAQSLSEINRMTDELLSVNFDSACHIAFGGKKLHKTSNSEEVAINKLYCGTCYRSGNQQDSAFLFLTEARDHFDESNDYQHLATVDWYIAKIWMNVHKAITAREHYDRALENFEKAGNDRGRLRVLNEVGVSYAIQGDWEQSLVYYQKALELSEQNDFEADRYRMLQNISIVYKEMKDFNRALTYNKQVLALTDTINNRDLIINALAQRALLFNQLNKKDSAELLIQKALDWANKYDRRSYVSRSLAHYYSSIENNRMAIKYLKEVLNNNYHPMGTDQNLLNLSNHYKAIGKIDSAKYYANEAYRYGLENGLKGTIYKSAMELADYYVEKSDYKNSYQYTQQALIYRDSVLNEDNKNAISNLTVQLETRDKIYEVEQLKLEAELIESERRFLIVTVILLIIISFLLYRHYRSRMRFQLMESQKLQYDLDIQKRSLQTQAMSMIRLINNLEEIRESLKAMKAKFKDRAADIQKIINKINVNKSLEKEWDSFNHSFTKVHDQFYDKLKKAFPNLTVNELRMCALVKMNMTNAEMSSLLNIESSSVRMAKYRLKKKLDLSDTDDLSEFISQFGDRSSTSNT